MNKLKCLLPLYFRKTHDNSISPSETFFPINCLFNQNFASHPCNPAGMDASQMHPWDISYKVSETSQGGLICKSLTPFAEDVKMAPQRRLWDLLGILKDVFELHLTLQFLVLKLRHFLATSSSINESLKILPN